MSYYSIPLLAGQPYKQPTSGVLLLIDSTGAADSVDVTLTKKNGADGTKMPGRKAAFRLVEEYDAVTFTSPVDTVLGVFLSTADVQLGFVSGGSVKVPDGVAITNDVAHAVPVNFTGTVAPVVGTLTNDDAHAVPVRNQALSTIVHEPVVTINTGAAQALVSDATLKRLYIKNSDPAANVAIGAAGVTIANAAIILAPGDVWKEDDAAGAAWYATSDTNGASVRVMGMK